MEHVEHDFVAHMRLLSLDPIHPVPITHHPESHHSLPAPLAFASHRNASTFAHNEQHAHRDDDDDNHDDDASCAIVEESSDWEPPDSPGDVRHHGEPAWIDHDGEDVTDAAAFVHGPVRHFGHHGVEH